MSESRPPKASEGTAYPWWMIIDPVQMMRPDVHSVARMITGPFFSRFAADQHLEAKRHRFSDRARVYCASAHMSPEWRAMVDEVVDDAVSRLSALVDVQAAERDRAIAERDALQAGIDDRDEALRAIIAELRAEVLGHVDLDALHVLDEVLGKGWAAIPDEAPEPMWCGCPADTGSEHRAGGDARALASVLRERGAPCISEVVGWCGRRGVWLCDGSDGRRVLDEDGEIDVEAMGWAEESQCTRRAAQDCGPSQLPDGAWWESCSGCTEMGDYCGNAHLYEYDSEHGCYLGAGCDECDGLGRVVMFGPTGEADE